MSILRQIGLLILLVGFVGGAYAAYDRFYGTDGEEQRGGRRGFGPTAIEFVPAKMTRLENRIEAVGTTLARRAVEIVPMASGRVTEMKFEPGSRVSKGDVIARLDDEIQMADLAEAEARLAEAELALERARTLGKTKTVSVASIEQLTAALASAQSGLDRARRRYADRAIEAPFDGVLGLNRVEVGARVSEGNTITTLDDLSQIEIEFSLPETVFGQIRPGLDIKADAAAFPGREFAGTIATIDSRVDPVSRSFKVRARLPNDDLALPAGMFMHLAIVRDARDAITIPEEAIVVEGDATTVFLFADGKALKRDVKVGSRQFGSVEVLDGLAAGDPVVTRGVHRLRDGMPVRDANAPPPAAGPGGRPGGRPGAGQRPGGRPGAGQQPGGGQRPGGRRDAPPATSESAKPTDGSGPPAGERRGRPGQSRPTAGRGANGGDAS